MLTLTERAADEVRSIMGKQGKIDHALRVFVTGGGCSGLQYGMSIDEPKDSDQIYESFGLRIITDPKSLPHIDGSLVDYEESLMGGGFKLDNPQAVDACGCGHSFQTKTTQAASGGGCGSGGLTSPSH